MVMGFECWEALEIFCFSKPPRMTLEPTQPPIQRVWGFIPGRKVARVCPFNTKAENE